MKTGNKFCGFTRITERYLDGQVKSGRLATRTLARQSFSGGGWAPLVATYSYNSAGDLTGLDYSDTTPDVTFTVDRLGRQITAGSSISAHEFAYSGLLLDTETIVSGGGTNVIDRSYDGYGRSTGFTLGGDYSATYGYNALSLFTSVSSSVASVTSVATYSYLANSGLISIMSNGVVVATRAYEDHRNLLTQAKNMAGTNIIAQFDYSTDAAGRRTQRIDFGGITNTFGYNTRSELTEANMSTNVYGYAYDPIGNRIWAIANVESNDYTANYLNQYTQISNQQSAIINPQFDWDGNLTNNGTWTYTWDGENRLIGATNESTVASYAYDYQSRRSQKVVGSTTNTFVYDGWNLITEIAVTPTPPYAVTNDYTWGLDLSGSLQGAGGIGGLQSVTRNGESYYPSYDANGNISDYTDTNGAVVAHREYDAFGNTTVATGSMVNDFNFWFSTKYLDQQTGLYYYGYRYYDPVTGRWLSRDPIGERGGISLYVFVYNSPMTFVDSFGLRVGQNVFCGYHKRGQKEFSQPSKAWGTSTCYKDVSQVVIGSEEIASVWGLIRGVPPGWPNVISVSIHDIRGSFNAQKIRYETFKRKEFECVCKTSGFFSGQYRWNRTGQKQVMYRQRGEATQKVWTKHGIGAKIKGNVPFTDIEFEWPEEVTEWGPEVERITQKLEYERSLISKETCPDFGIWYWVVR